MRSPPTVRVLEELEPIFLDGLHEIRVELLEVDGFSRIRAREWERPPVRSEQEEVDLWMSTIREFIVLLVPDTVIDFAAEQFTSDACSLIGAHLVSAGSHLASGDRVVPMPSEVMEWLEESGILAHYNIPEPQLIPSTFGVQEWQPTDEVVEVENPTIGGWLGVVRAVERCHDIEYCLGQPDARQLLMALGVLDRR